MQSKDPIFEMHIVIPTFDWVEKIFSRSLYERNISIEELVPQISSSFLMSTFGVTQTTKSINE